MSARLGPPGGGLKPLNPSEVKYIAVHCSATPEGRDIGRLEIERMHRERGFATVGYHFIIRLDGTTEMGRPLDVRGAHVENWNHNSVGVCLIGGVDKALKPKATFTERQLDTLKILLQGLQKQFPKAQVQGHRDFPKVAKACPSFDVRHWLATGVVRP